MTMAKKYKAADLCRELGIQPYVLRYWETEFPTLRDQMVGSSTYTEEALEIARRIKALLYDEGYTIVGAKKKLAAKDRYGRFPTVQPALFVLNSTMQVKKPIGRISRN